MRFCSFDLAKQRIEAKYNDIERTLLDDFRHAFIEGDKRKMKRLMGILSNFRVRETAMMVLSVALSLYNHRDVLFRAMERVLIYSLKKVKK